jgi:hypothetical protein
MENRVLFLLQTLGLSNFQIQPKPIQGIIFAVGVVTVVFLIVYFNKSKKIKSNPIFQTGTIDKTDLGALAVKGMGKIARKYGLDADEQKTLAKVLRSAELDIATVFNSPDDIDTAFSRMVSALGREDDSEQTIAKLFAVRNKVEYYSLINEDTDSPEKNKTPRRYRRKKVNIPVSFCLVVVSESRQGPKKIKKLSLDSNKLSGTLLDLSAGGCSISTGSSVKAGSRIKIEFNIGKASLAALALTLRVNQAHSENVLHARFIKVPAKTLNAINALVYNYRDI